MNIVVKECSNAQVLEPGKYGIFGFTFERYNFDLIHVTYSLLSSCKGTSDRLSATDALVKYYFIQCRVLDWQIGTKWSYESDNAIRLWCKAVMRMYGKRDFKSDIEFCLKFTEKAESEILLIKMIESI